MYTNVFARFLLVIGGINYLFMSVNDKYPIMTKFIFILIGLSALYFLFDRDFYLPFLGECAIPIGVRKPIENLKKIKLSDLPPNTNIIYWAAKPSSQVIENPFEAYKDYSNSNVGKSDNNGDIIIELECPSEYMVPKFGFKRKLKRHIHYRFELPQYKGLFSKVYTKYLDFEC
jgi:hypothetical protein